MTARLDRPGGNIPPALTADLRRGVRAATNAVAAQVALEATKAVRRVLGADQRLSGHPRAPQVRLVVTPARTDMDAAVVRAVGPWALIERPRRGGYAIRPRRADALNIGGVPRADATGGAITRPRAPITTVFARYRTHPRTLEQSARAGMASKTRGTYG